MNRSPQLLLVALSLVAAVAAAETNAEAASGASPLRLIAPERASDPAAAASDAGARLRNVSDEPLAGWHFACVVGLRDGRSGWVGGGQESFVAPRSGSALLAPGETAPVTLPAAPARESPFDVWGCGPTAAVFADGRTWGAPEVLDRYFGRLVAQAGEARRLLDAIERLQPEGGDDLLTGGEAMAALQAVLPEDRLGDYRGRVAALGAAAAGSEVASRLASLAAEVRRDLDALLPRLRPQDRRRLDGGAPPPPVPPPGQRTAVVVALSEGAPELSSADDLRFDLDGGGRAEAVVWPRGGPEVAFLALDRDGSGRIESGLELFGDASPQVPSAEANGFRALALFDDPHNGGDGDGRIGPGDEVFEWLLLWRDRDGDRASQPGELTPAREAGLEGIDLAYGPAARSADAGDRLRSATAVHWRDGIERRAWDVSLAAAPASTRASAPTPSGGRPPAR